MRKFLFAFTALLASALAAPVPAPKPQTWQGKLSYMGQSLTIVITCSRGSQGGWTGAMAVPEQGAFGLKCTGMSLTKTEFKWSVTGIGATFDGKLSADGKTATGKFTQGPVALPLTLKRTSAVAAAPPKRPQTPKPPFPYLAKEVSYPNSSAGITLGGTLTMPKSGGPFPAVILITGSGQQDRDETLFGHKPFFVLADYLTRRGIAVLRVDDRGMGKSTGDFAKSTTKDFATDVEAGVSYLLTRSDIDPQRIGLLGHSEGGIIAPMVAAEDPRVAFIVLMAGTGVKGSDLIVKQGELIAKAQGAPDAAVAKAGETQRKVFDILASESDDASAREAIVKVLTAAAPPVPDAAAQARVKAAAEAEAKQMTGPWMRFFASYDPAVALRKLKIPVLAVIGGHDLQVPQSQNLPAIEAALKEAGNTKYKIVDLPELNHLFQRCKTGSPTEYARIEQTIDPVALKTFGDWIVQVTAK